MKKIFYINDIARIDRLLQGLIKVMRRTRGNIKYKYEGIKY